MTTPIRAIEYFKKYSTTHDVKAMLERARLKTLALQGNAAAVIDRHLAAMLIEKAYDVVAPCLDASVNFTAKMARELARNYREPPRRWIGARPVNDEESAETMALRAFADEALLDAMCLDAERLVRVCGAVATRYRPWASQHGWLATSQFLAMSEPGAPFIISAIAIPFDVDRQRYFEIWTDDSYFVVTDSFTPVTDLPWLSPWARAMVNPYQIIPWSVLSLGLTYGDIHEHRFTGEDIFAATETIGAFQTIIKSSIAMSGKRIVTSIDPSAQDQRMLADARMPIRKEPSDDLAVIDLTGPISTYTAAVTEAMSNVARTYGLNPSEFFLTGDVLTASAMQLGAAKIAETNREARPFLRRWERDLYRRTRAVAAIDNAGLALAVPPDGELGIDYYSLPGSYVDTTTQISNDRNRIMMGVESIVDVIMRDNPGLTRADAEAMMARNIKELVQVFGLSFGAGFQTLSAPSTPGSAAANVIQPAPPVAEGVGDDG